MSSGRTKKTGSSVEIHSRGIKNWTAAESLWIVYLLAAVFPRNKSSLVKRLYTVPPMYAV